MLCSTGYLKKDEVKGGDCSCRKNGMKCMCCPCACDNQVKSNETRVELTKRGRALTRRKWDEKTGRGAY